jgi:hypothetical protein
MRVDLAEFRKLDLRCHALLSDVPLHDVWAIPLHDGGPGRTMSEVRALIFETGDARRTSRFERCLRSFASWLVLAIRT